MLVTCSAQACQSTNHVTSTLAGRLTRTLVYIRGNSSALPLLLSFLPQLSILVISTSQLRNRGCSLDFGQRRDMHVTVRGFRTHAGLDRFIQLWFQIFFFSCVTSLPMYRKTPLCQKIFYKYFNFKYVKLSNVHPCVPEKVIGTLNLSITNSVYTSTSLTFLYK